MTTKVKYRHMRETFMRLRAEGVVPTPAQAVWRAAVRPHLLDAGDHIRGYVFGTWFEGDVARHVNGGLTVVGETYDQSKNVPDDSGRAAHGYPGILVSLETRYDGPDALKWGPGVEMIEVLR